MIYLVAPTPVPVPPTSSPLYCFPDAGNGRVSYKNVWNKYTVEVKEGAVCGPGANRFSQDTVAVQSSTTASSLDELKVLFAPSPSDGTWEASEVRVLLPLAEMPFGYGTFSFSVKSMAVIDISTNTVTSNILPADLVLGLFTWDPTESYGIHENWNHEVDVEISRWGDPSNSDAQVCLPSARFFSLNSCFCRVTHACPLSHSAFYVS
jgi:hypothetical protein